MTKTGGFRKEKLNFSDDIFNGLFSFEFSLKCFNSINKVQYHFLKSDKLNWILDKFNKENMKWNVIEETQACYVCNIIIYTILMLHYIRLFGNVLWINVMEQLQRCFAYCTLKEMFFHFKVFGMF